MMTPFVIGDQWPTKDPFLFVAHHADDYPAGNGDLGPADSLAGRSIGSDFAGLNGWNMYHGSVVPGFPQHPHRGFETVTHLRVGTIDHSDSLGATARFGPGDTQWMTAGAGIVHSEMFPLLRSDGPNPLEMFQIWLNLPAAAKMVPPYFTMMWADATPVHRLVGDGGTTTTLTTISGSYNGMLVAEPPPDSWAGQADAEVAIWHIDMDAGARFRLPATSPGVVRTLYVYRGSSLSVGGNSTMEAGVADAVRVDVSHGVELPADTLDLVAADGDSGAGTSAMLLQGRPIGEPVAQYGPFVMNDRSGLEQAFRDYQHNQFGGWPWTRDDPTHERSAARFAIHPDGRREEPEPELR